MTEEPTQIRGDLPSTSNGELAKALAAFQKENYAAEKTGFIKGWKKANGQVGQPDRHFSNLEDILKAVKGGANYGLCHTETWHPIGTNHAILRVTLHHVSGESVKSELPVDITQEMRGGSKEQAQGSSMTYARRYLLMGIYGIVGADKSESDDDGDLTRTSEPVQASKPAAKPITPTQTETKPAEPSPVSAAAKAGGVVFMTDSEKSQCIDSLKGLSAQQREKLKADFKAEFKISAVKISPEHFQLPKHGAWVKENLASYQ
jgi:hypothetical protein